MKRPRITADDVADTEEAIADRWAETFQENDDTEFLRADAAERRRLAAIIREEQEKERKEEEELRKKLMDIKKKKALKKV